MSFIEPFDLIVNDMNISPLETAAVMCDLAPLLRPGAAAVVTLKLATSDCYGAVLKVDAAISRVYDLTNIANLAHNRSEVTAIMRRL